MTRRILLSLVLVLAALGAGWWFYGRALEVTSVQPRRGTAVEIVYATGAVEPVRWAKIASLVRERIIEICTCEGKAVVKGDVLMRLDDREARAQLEELRAREEFIRREMTRASELIARGSATTQSYERASMELRQIEAQISVQLEKIGDYVFRAPMDGVVLRLDGEVGEVAESGKVLIWVGVPKPLQVVAEVNEEDIPRVAVDQKVLFRTDAFPDTRLEGRVREITPMGDAVAKTYRIKINLSDNTPLKPGMSVEANVITREKPGALLVPADAVQGSALFVVEDGVVRRRDVKTGIRGIRAVEILSGVNEGERVVSPAPTGLKDGQRVRVSEGQPAGS